MIQIPTKRLNDGTEIPVLGFGAWQLPEDRVPEILGHALGAGWRHFDTAHAYLNERAIGRYLAHSGIPRDEIFLTSKLWNNCHGYDEALRAFDGTMKRLGMDVLDLYLIHWPVPMENEYVETWKALIRLEQEGRIRSIGVSNFDEEHLEHLISETGTAPSVNQIELHPRFQRRADRNHHDQMGIAIQSWSPLGRGNVMQDKTLKTIAEKHGKTVAQVVLRWHLDQDLIAIPRSKSPANISANINVFDFSLDAEDMAAIASLDRDEVGRIGPKPRELGPVDLPRNI